MAKNFAVISKIATKILNGLRRKKKTAAIFFGIEKPYKKINRNKTGENGNTGTSDGIYQRTDWQYMD